MLIQEHHWQWTNRKLNDKIKFWIKWKQLFIFLSASLTENNSWHCFLSASVESVSFLFVKPSSYIISESIVSIFAKIISPVLNFFPGKIWSWFSLHELQLNKTCFFPITLIQWRIKKIVFLTKNVMSVRIRYKRFHKSSNSCDVN